MFFIMGKSYKIVICGMAGVGKTAILEQVVHGNHVVGTPMFSTIEDIYMALFDTDRNQKEKIHLFDLAGVTADEASRPELPRHYLNLADAYIIVYDVTNELSFQCMHNLRKFIEKNKEKKEAVVIVLGNKCDLFQDKKVDFTTSNKWAQSEKVRLWEVSVSNINSLVDPFTWVASKISQPPPKRFPAFGSDAKRKDAS